MAKRRADQLLVDRGLVESRTRAQALILAVLAYPFMLALIPLGLASFRWAGHDPAQIPLESTYFRILMYGTLIMLARSAVSGFFSGIGRTRIIMFANIAALAVTVTSYISCHRC